jgi:hypothetical protein
MGKLFTCGLSPCQLILECVAAASCDPDSSCVTACELADPGGKTAYEALQSCAVAACPVSCAGM